jgi:riboflavin-specific deaminase-like protein
MRPYVTISYGQSLDGRVATATGDSQWIGGPESLSFAHELRRDNQAILVGIGTVMQDNPRLTCRLPGGRNPIRIVLDSQLKIPIECHLADTSEAQTWVIAATTASEAKEQTLISLSMKVHRNPGGLPELLDWLGEQGIGSLFVEGGARVVTSFFREKLVDRLLAVTAPFVIGKGTEAIGDLGHRVLSEVPRPLRWSRRELGQDHVTELIFRESPENG